MRKDLPHRRGHRKKARPDPGHLSGSALEGGPICTESLRTQNENPSLLFSACSESKLACTCVAFTHAASVGCSGPGTIASVGSPLKPRVTATITHVAGLRFVHGAG